MALLIMRMMVEMKTDSRSNGKKLSATRGQKADRACSHLRLTKQSLALETGKNVQHLLRRFNACLQQCTHTASWTVIAVGSGGIPEPSFEEVVCQRPCCQGNTLEA